MKRLFLLIGLILPSTLVATAQEQPPVHFPPGHNVCDPAPYQLVFDDEFNGNSVDYTKWRTWGTWNGDDTDDWSDARWDGQLGTTIRRDKNVVVGGGIARMQIYHSAETWKCDTCHPWQVHNADYSSGCLTTKFSQHYNNGRFEARLKFPKADHMWSTMWTYHGGANGGINENDIAEAHGGPLTSVGQNNYTISHSTHVQKPDSSTPNPYNLPERNKTTHYPHSDWWDIVNGSFFDMDNWHTYALEWDTALISNYLDGNLIFQEPKYYYKTSIPQIQCILFFCWQTGSITTYHNAICTTDDGQLYHINPYFPYNNNSQSILIFSTQMDKDLTPKGPRHQPLTGSTFVGELQLDYARIWQRHPEKDGHVNICDQTPAVNVTGPNVVCATATYTANAYPAIAGSWSTSSNLNIISQSSTPTTSTITVQKPATTLSSYGTVTFTTNVAGCPAGVITKPVDVGPPRQFSANIVRTKLYSGTQCFYDLFATNPYPQNSFLITASPTTYKWDIWYGFADSNHLVAYGQHLSTNIVPTGGGPGMVHGTLTITNNCGSTTISINKFFAAKGTSEEEAGTVNYFNAEITDTAAFRAAVESGIQNQYVPDTLADDTSAVRQIIEKSITRALAPYLLMESTIKERAKSSPGNAISARTDATSVYPNPTDGVINVLLGAQFDLSASTIVSIADLYGRTLLSKTFSPGANETLQISIASLAAGTYTVSVSQDKNSKQFLITRR